MANLRFLPWASAAIMACSSPALAQNREPAPDVTIAATLDRFVEDYSADPMARPITFGIEVDGFRWRVTVEEHDETIRAEMHEGFGDEELFYFSAGRETLNLLDQGIWNGLTAMGAATSADETPLDVLATENYVRPDDYDAVLRRLIFHFWTRGMPETVRFGPPHARVVHGAPAAALYYDEDFRSAVYHVPAGLGREQAPTLAVPFPRMVIIIAGSAEGEIDGEPFTAAQGEMMFAPPNLPVTFWNASNEDTLSFVWLMWGDGA